MIPQNEVVWGSILHRREERIRPHLSASVPVEIRSTYPCRSSGKMS